MSAAFGAITGAAALIGGAVTAAGAAIVALGVRGSVVADVRDAFGQLSRGAGEAADVMLGKLTQGTLGTVSNFELMQLANKALGTGLIKSAEDMGTLAAGAKLLADRTGGDTKEAFETLTSAMASGRTAQLKQLGLFVDSKVAVEQYAQKLGKSASDLTDHERATALSQGALKALKEELDASGGKAADFSDNIDRGKVAVQNFVDDLAVAVATSPVVAAAMKAMGEAISQAFGGRQQDAVKTLTGSVNRFAIFIVQAGQVAVTAGQVIVGAFGVAKIAFNAILEAIAGGAGKVAGLLADVAEKARELPVVGRSFDGIASGLRTATDFANSLAFGFGDLKDQAAQSAIAAHDSLDTFKRGFAGAEAEMRKALKAGDELVASTDSVATGLRQVGEAAGLTAAQIKAIEDATRAGQVALIEGKEFMLDAFTRLQEEITLAQKTGLDQRLFEIQLAQQKEIAGLQAIAFEYPARYEEITQAVIQKYQLMSQAAVESQLMQAEAATQGAMTQVQQAQATLSALQAFYAALAASGVASYAQLARAAEAVAKAESALGKTKTQEAIDNYTLVASAASSILRSIFGKSKAAAIAAAIIDTLAGIAKALGAYPWPFNLVAAAAVAAAGYANVAKIRSTEAEGFQEGTPGTAFQDFGRGSLEVLHGREAVVTPGQAESVGGIVAAMVAEALKGQVRDQRAPMAPMGGDVYLDGEQVGRWFARHQRAGFLGAPA